MKNKKISVLIFLLFVCAYTLHGQSVEHNLEKYWYYRQRLKSDFMAVSANNEYGTDYNLQRK